MLKYKVLGLGTLAFFAIAAGTCPQSKDGNAQCCSTSAKSCNTTINWPAKAEQKESNKCTEVTCDSIRVSKSCTGPNSDKKCSVNADSVTQTFKLYGVIKDTNGNCADCGATVLNNYAHIINCNTTTNGDDVDPLCVDKPPAG